MLADSEARRCFLFGTWRSAVAEPFANRRSQQLAAGQPSDVLALCWILALAERDRSLKSARKGGRVNNVMVVSSCARGRRLGQRIRSAAPARSYRVGRGTTRSNPLAEGGCGVCALWHFRLGDRLLIGGCAGAERRAAIEGKQGDC